MKHVCSFLIFTLFSVNLYSQVSPSNERIVKQEVDKAVSCITASRDDSCTPKDRFGSAATLELLYSNDLIDKDTNAIVQGKLLYHKTGDNGVCRYVVIPCFYECSVISTDSILAIRRTNPIRTAV